MGLDPTDDLWGQRLDRALSSHAVDDGDLTSAYQPIVDLARGTVVGYEALARFPGFDERNPEVWFSTARLYGFAAELEAVALRSALRRRGTLPGNCFLTINVSPDLLSTEAVRRVWREQGDLTGLIIELTEQAPIESYAALEPDLNRLRAAGALIAVDDAGSGYAGLQHLVRLRPALIKLDRALVQDVDVDEAKRALVEMIGTFGSRIDAWVLAEGVERVEELNTLAGLGVPLAQGYVLARPGPPWATISADIALQLAAGPHPYSGDGPAPADARTVRAALEVAPTVDDVERAPGVFAAAPHAQSVVLVDATDRPLSVLSARADPMAPTDGIRVNVQTPLVDALERAVTRPPDQRFEPLLITDAAGRYLGVARVERLITAVTKLVD